MAKAKVLITEGRIGRLVSVMGSAVFFKPDSYFASNRAGHELSSNITFELGFFWTHTVNLRFILFV